MFINKEFEALEFLKQQAIAFEHSELAIKVANGNHTIVKQALTELKQIKEAKPSEALENLESIALWSSDYDDVGCYRFENEYQEIKQALLKAQEQEKVLEIIRKKLIDTVYLRLCFKTSNGLEKYNNCHKVGYKLTEEEYNLLKRWSEKCIDKTSF